MCFVWRKIMSMVKGASKSPGCDKKRAGFGALFVVWLQTTKTSLCKPKRKVFDERRQFQERWTFRFFHEAKKDADAGVEASYVVSELIAKAGQPLTKGQFLKDWMLQVTDILRPERNSLFNSISPSADTAAERIPESSGDAYDQLRGKAKSFRRLTKAQTKPTKLS